MIWLQAGFFVTAIDQIRAPALGKPVGLYVDMDGSTADAGMMTPIQPFNESTNQPFGWRLVE